MGTFRSLSGRTFGRWTVSSEFESRRDMNGTSLVYWKCICACGSEKWVKSGILTKGESRSCGCLHKDKTSEKFLIPLSGKRFGRWTVTEEKNRITFPGGKTGIYWGCVCDCGNTKDVLGSSLRSGDSQSCGCLHAESTSLSNSRSLIGMKFGRLLVTSDTERRKTQKGRSQIYWKCVCDCGAIRWIQPQPLISGKSRSCGCLHKQITSKLFLKTLTGKRFGKWTVTGTSIRKTFPNGKTGVFWICTCDCGTTKEVSSSALRQGSSKGCGRRQCYSNWLGGEEFLYDIGYRGPGWNSIAAKIRIRDDHTCRRCGITQAITDRKFPVHHVVPFRNFTNWRDANRKSNLETLCGPCHRKTEVNTQERQMFLFGKIAR